MVTWIITHVLAPGLASALGLKLYSTWNTREKIDPNELLFQPSFNLFKETDYKYK